MRSDTPVDHLAEVVIGAFFDVYNALRHGFLEQVYVQALAHDLERLGLPFRREQPIEVFYRRRAVGFYRADLVVASRLIVEVKAGKALDDSARWQTLHYLRATNLPLGLVLHFGPEARFHRVIGPSHPMRRREPRASDDRCSPDPVDTRSPGPGT